MAVGHIDGQETWGGSGRGTPNIRQEPLPSGHEHVEAEFGREPLPVPQPQGGRGKEPFREGAD